MPARPSLLFASPLPPQRSGVAAYSQALVPELRARFQVTLLTGGEGAEGIDQAGDIPVLRHGRDAVDPDGFDHVLYNLGNNPYFHAHIYQLFLRRPAPVILHDVVLYYLTVGYYRDAPDFYQRLYAIGGAPAVATLRDARKAGVDPLHLRHVQELPLNREILERAPLLFVHSRHARDLLAPHCRAPIRCIPMPAPPLPAADPDYLRQRHQVPDDAVVLASVGHIAPTKQNLAVCRALPALQERLSQPLYYVMAGEGSYVDDELGPRVIKTGYLPDAAYHGVLERCDLVLNLRYPSMGETSLSLVQAMAAGKACVVTDDAWFRELPDQVALRIPAAEPEKGLVAALPRLLADPAVRRAYGMAAREHAGRGHRPGDTAAALSRHLGADLQRAPVS